MNDLTYLEKFDAVVDNAIGDETIVSDVLEGKLRSLIVRMEDKTMTVSGRYETMGELMASCLRECLDARHGSIESYQDDCTRDGEHLEVANKESGEEFARAHNDALGAKT